MKGIEMGNYIGISLFVAFFEEGCLEHDTGLIQKLLYSRYCFT
jgi:hypothetical protein